MMGVLAAKINLHYDGLQALEGSGKMTDITPRHFIFMLISLSLAYLGFEWWFNQYAMISVDEFWFAHRIYEYKSGLPYRDFAPYKTVLGYYLLLPSMLFSEGIIHTLIIMKNVIAVTNVMIITLASCWLTRFFSRKAVIASLCLLFSMEIMLSYSTHIRVDLYAYWFCLFSLLCLLESRFVAAGLLLGLGFSTSQKAIWYLAASNAALGLHWCLSARNRQFFFDAVRFNLATALVIAAYLGLWSAVAGSHTVFHSVFGEASAMYHLDWYNAARQLYWTVILALNPLAFTLWPLALLSLMITFPNDKHYLKRRFVIVYAFTIMLCLIPYKQVFPYYMQVTLPAFLVLYAAFFSWLFGLIASSSTTWLVNKTWGYGYIAVYITTMAALIILFKLPTAYLFVCFMPILILARNYQSLLLINLIFIGAIYPFALYATKLIGLDGHYQKANIAAVNVLLEDGSDYTAGIELIYNKTQPIAGLRHLMGPAIDYLYQPTERLKPVMTASLYEDPNVTADSVKQSLQASRVKFYVNNYRIECLPPTIKKYLTNHFQHLWGSIYIYSPMIAANTQQTEIKFTGFYEVQTDDTNIKIDGISFKNKSYVKLNSKKITTWAAHPFRLMLLPTHQNFSLENRFRNDEWEKIIF